MAKTFPWGQDYFVARVLLGFSEEEFWQSSPRKIYTLKHYRDRHFGGNQKKKTTDEQISEIRSLLGI